MDRTYHLTVPVPVNGETWIKLSHAAQFLKVSRQAVYQRIHSGKMTSWHFGPRKTFVLADDVHKWAMERK